MPVLFEERGLNLAQQKKQRVGPATHLAAEHFGEGLVAKVNTPETACGGRRLFMILDEMILRACEQRVSNKCRVVALVSSNAKIPTQFVR